MTNNTCRNKKCHRPTDLFLCTDCTNTLHDMINEIPWLLTELETTIRRQDKLTAGGIIGKSCDTPSPINFDAMNVKRDALEAINDITRYCHLSAKDIARHKKAGHHYREIANLVGEGEDGGRLVQAINRQERTYYGPCTTITGRDRQGRPRVCGQDLYAPKESVEITCPKCGGVLNPQRQLMSTITDRDLVTELKLLETLDTLGEHVPRGQLYAWIRAGRLVPRGWVHQGRIVPARVRRGDPRVFSLSQARQLRWHDQKPANAG